MPLELKSMTDLSANKKLSMFMYGEPGTWKTVTACRIGTDQGRVILNTMNRDHRSLFNHPEYLKHVDIIEYDGVDQILELAADLNAGAYPDHSTVVIDTISGWSDHFLRELAKYTKFGDNSRGIIKPRPGKPGAAKFIQKMDLVATEQADYNVLRIEIQEIVRSLCASGKNIIFNCHSRVAEKDKIDNYTHTRPDMPEGAYRNTVEECDVMGYCKKGTNGIPTITFGGGNRVATKSRVKELENVTFKHPDEFVEVVNNYLASA